MGLSDVLARLAVRRVHVLLVEVPGWWSVRVAVQQELAARGWPEASSPAEADVLVVCGVPGDRLADAVRLVHDQMPGPRALVAVRAHGDVAAALDEAAGRLTDVDAQRADARDRAQEPQPAGGTDHGDMDGGTDHGDMDGDTDHGDMAHGDMGGGMGMSPGGIPLASGGPDRDGLEMDRLVVPFGPVLQDWPAGLVLRCTLQGDVVVAADAEVLDAGAAPPGEDGSDRVAAARSCDQARQLLRLAGWPGVEQLGGVRDDLLAGVATSTCLRRLERVTGRVARSRVLRWSLRDVGGRGAAGAPGPGAGDVHDRLLAVLRAAEARLRGDGDGPPAPAPAGPQEVAQAVVGLDVAAARLVVASLAPGPVPARASGPRP